MKALGQAGLDFIANKYKELKTLINKKADKSEIKTKLSELTGDSTHRTVTDSEKTKWNNKVDKVDGKGLSTNDYDNTARALVEAIPANPKYTDTVVDVVDNLTTSDATKALSAKQGKTLNDSLSAKADKSNISRCKTKGYNTSNTWQSLSTERDLEDWIGDFDKRTRELKSGGVEYTVNTRYNEYAESTDIEWMFLKIGKYVIASYVGRDRGSEFAANTQIPSGWRPTKNIPLALMVNDSRGGLTQIHFTLKPNGTIIAGGSSNDYPMGAFTLIYECA